MVSFISCEFEDSSTTGVQSGLQDKEPRTLLINATLLQNIDSEKQKQDWPVQGESVPWVNQLSSVRFQS